MADIQNGVPYTNASTDALTAGITANNTREEAGAFFDSRDSATVASIVTNAGIGGSVADGSLTNAKIAANAAIAQTKIAGLTDTFKRNLVRGPVASGAQPSNASTFSDGIVTGGNFRKRHLSGVKLRQIRIRYTNTRNNNGVEADGNNSITVRAGLESPVATMIPVFFAGKRDVVIEPGATVTSDPVTVNIAANTAFYTRTLTTVQSGDKWPITQLNGNYDTSSSSTSETDKTITGTITGTANGFGPSSIISDFIDSTTPIIGGIGDSIMTGAGDSTSGSTQGWIGIALDGVRAYGRIPQGGQSAYNFMLTPANRYRLMPLLAGCNIWIVSLGINDIFQTLSTIQTNLQAIWQMGVDQGAKVYQTTITPKTTSTDTWATTGNQTVSADESKRVQLNDWIRSIPSAYLTDYLEFADAAETARNSGIWKAGGTGDGTHPTTTIHTAMAAVLTAKLPVMVP